MNRHASRGPSPAAPARSSSIASRCASTVNVDGRTTPATIRDHVVPLAEGGHDVDANVQALCVACHDVKTQAEQAARGYTGYSQGPIPHTVERGASVVTLDHSRATRVLVDAITYSESSSRKVRANSSVKRNSRIVR